MICFVYLFEPQIIGFNGGNKCDFAIAIGKDILTKIGHNCVNLILIQLNEINL
jgi:hypothetical protein